MVFFALMAASVAIGGFVLWRLGRRKWRAFRSHGAVLGALALWEATATLPFRRGTVVPPSPQDIDQWTPRKVRREMWRAVDRADAAVRAAAEVGAPTADLPFLCRRLQAAAVDLDKVLRVEASGMVPVEVYSQASEVIRAASDVQRAGVASASDVNGQRVRDLTRDADQEIRCLDAGLASARAALPDHRR